MKQWLLSIALFIVFLLVGCGFAMLISWIGSFQSNPPIIY